MSDVTSAKYLNKQMKAKGLQKLRFYCQVCQKQCRDDNGFKSHIKSPSHLRNISNVSSEDITKYTDQFEKDFLTHLRVNHGEKPIAANKVYNEFIQDKDHIHMNATQFTSLSKFIQHLSKEGKIKIRNLEDFAHSEDVEMGHLLISYIDTSGSNALHKQQLEEIEEQEKSDRDVKDFLLQKQIAAGASSSTSEAAPSEISAVESLAPGETIALSISSTKKIGKVQKKKKPRKNVFS